MVVLRFNKNGYTLMDETFILLKTKNFRNLFHSCFLSSSSYCCLFSTFWFGLLDSITSDNKIDATAYNNVYIFNAAPFFMVKLSVFHWLRNYIKKKISNFKFYWTQNVCYIFLAQGTTPNGVLVQKFGWLIKWEYFSLKDDDDKDGNRKL